MNIFILVFCKVSEILDVVWDLHSFGSVSATNRFGRVSDLGTLHLSHLSRLHNLLNGLLFYIVSSFDYFEIISDNFQFLQ